MSKLFNVLKKGAKDFSDDECMTSGAAIAYYTIFSLPPLLVLVFFVAHALGVSDETIDQIVRKQIGIPLARQEASQQGQQEQAQDGTQEESATLQNVAQRASATDVVSSLGPLSRVVGIAILVFSATTVFAQLQFALNRAWEVEPDPQHGGVKNFITKRLLSLGMILAIAFLLLVSMVLTAVLDEIMGMIVGEQSGTFGKVVAYIVNSLVALVVVTVLFALMYKFLPDAKMRWKDVWAGAFITALLFVIGKSLISLYLQHSNVGSSWGGAAASMVGMLVWVYYTSLIVLFGAELAQVWANEYGAGIQPEKGAVRIKEEKRHIRGGKAHPA